MSYSLILKIMKTLLLILILAPFCVLSQVNLTQNLIGHWQFNGNANDSSPFGHNGTVNGANLVAGKMGIPNSAYYFNGFSDFIQISNSPLLNSFSGDSMTIYAFVKVSGFYSGPCHGNCILDKGNSDYISGHYTLRYSDAYLINLQNCNVPVNTSLQNYSYHINGQILTTGSGYYPVIDTALWDCIIATSDGDSSRLYVNGVLKQIMSLNTPMGSNTNDLFFGRKNNSLYPYWFNGIIDEIRIYNRVINTQEIDSLCSQFNNSSLASNFGYQVNNGCASSTVQFTDSSATGNSAIQSWFWDFGDGSSSNQQNPLHTYTSNGNYSVKLIITDFLGNIDSTNQTITIQTYGQPNISINTQPNPLTLCQGDTCILTAYGALTYIWNGGIQNAVPFIPVNSGVYTVIGTDANGCTNSSSLNVIVNPIPNIIATSSPQNICIGNSVQLTASGGISYQWNNNIQNGQNIFPNSKATYTVVGTSSNGCSNSATVLVTVYPNPIVQANTSANPICFGENISLYGTGADIYTWNLGVQNNVAFNPSTSDNYIVTGTDLNGCSSLDSIYIVVLPTPVISVFPNDTTLCNGDKVILNAEGALSYDWQASPSLTVTSYNQAMVQPTQSQVYYVTGTDGNGCTQSTFALINIKLIDLKISKNRDATCSDRKVFLTALGADSLLWSPSHLISDSTAPSVIATIQENTLFYLTGELDGCKSKDSILVKFLAEADADLFIPNAFSPNSDGLNDCFSISNRGETHTFGIQLFNRWGQRIFESNDPNFCWNGYTNGMKVDLGVYYYILEISTGCGKTRKVGDLSVVY